MAWESDKFLKDALELADTLVVVIDMQGYVRFFNKRAQELTGYAAEEVLGKLWVDTFVAPRHKSAFTKIIHGFAEGTPVSKYGEYPILAKGGAEIPIAWSRAFIRGGQPGMQAVLSIGYDLSLTKMMEEERVRNQTILDSIADGVFTVDPEFRITSFNEAATKITGFRREEAIGQPCRDILRSRLCTSQCPLKKSIETGNDSVNLEADILDKRNREIPISFSTAVRRDSAGQPAGGILVFRDLSPILELKKELQGKYSFQDIISKNKKVLEIFRILPDVAESDASVLITGESGTGKELVASAIHNLSRRREKPFVKVNCGALPETLLESELFGYKRGAFTDARQDKPGRFRLADGGSIFLDEIGDTSLGTQVKLLRVLENKEYEPLGGTRTERANVRVITATNKDLGALVQSGNFREDLYYRLNLFTIEIPPLRERPEDIPLLIEHFLTRFNRTKSRNVSGLSRGALQVLLTHNYPGNVRELQNIMEYAFILCKSRMIGVECLPAYLKKKTPLDGSAKGKDAVDGFERALILETLERHGGKMKEAADEMGLHRVTLWRKMNKTRIGKRA